MRFFEKLIANINEYMMWICGSLIMFMGLLITVDIILRSTINYSIQWAFSLNGYISATVALLAGGYALLHKHHVKVDIFYMRFPSRVKGIVDIGTSSLLFLLCGVFVWTGGSLCFESFASGYTTGGVLDMPLYIPQMLVPLGGALLGLQAFVDLTHNIKLALGIKTLVEEGSS
ncbi:MAG: hypothetical protein JL56_10315 [Desulfotomaculum sp. BICA1-6]|nr:MAG: hypothetical protein JL56_10315 [Desulfotomaculum sp. BICA1-6]